MEGVIVGILAIVVGALFCFRGYLAMRGIIPIWGGFAGFFLGAGVVASFTGEGFLATTLAWIVGLGVALLFALLAYLYYEVSVVLAMSAIGFALGTGFMAVIGVTWSWLILLVGVGVGVLLAILAIVADIPTGLLTLLTALAGSTAIVAGILLVTGTIEVSELGTGATTARIGDDWWWYVIYLGLAIAGIISQIKSTARLRASLRESWQEAGGRELRAS